MKPVKQKESKIVVIVQQSQLPKKPTINKFLLKAIALFAITLISWLNPEATIAIAMIKFFFIFLEWLNRKEN